ncbi:MAG: nickel-binding protein [Dehalococcoidia bacterium]
MPQFIVLREFPPGLSQSEGEANIARGITGSVHFPFVRWHGTYGVSTPERIHGFCVFDAPSFEAMAEHAHYCRVPFTEIREVDEVDPRTFPTAGIEVPAYGSLFLIERRMDPALNDDELEALSFRSANCLNGFPGLGWELSYWDAERRVSRCIFRSPAPALIQEHASRVRVPCDSIEEVTFVDPADWGWLYDVFGLPKHWEAGATLGGPRFPMGND